MRYVNATALLPEDLIERLQNFAQGEYIYIPAKKDQHKKWGELSGYRKELDNRNRKILQAHNLGLSIDELADKFFLSVHAIRKIIYNK